MPLYICAVNSSELYMKRCLELAELGRGRVAPNPLVGSVVVHNDRIIGEGYHQVYGEAHAEVNAIESVKDKDLIKDSIIYVNLEPCSHHGKTPPCADRISDLKPRKVVIAVKDPNPKVSGRGIEKMRNAGIEVEIGLLEEESRRLNRAFFSHFEQKRPYITLKWAQSSDGFIAPEGQQLWLSGHESRVISHKLRAENMAILVGANTVSIDNPSLTTRNHPGTNPIRLVLDAELELSKDHKVFDSEAKSIWFNFKESGKEGQVEKVKLDPQQPVSNQISNVLQDLDINSLIVEGGAQTLSSFIQEGSWDEAYILESGTIISEGIPAPSIWGDAISKKRIGKDQLSILKRI